MDPNILIPILLGLLLAGSVVRARARQPEVPKSKDAVVQHLKTMETLRLAEHGYTVNVDHDGVRSVRPMPWRQILNHLCSSQSRCCLQVMYASGDMDDDIVVQRIRANGQADAQHPMARGPGTICCVGVRAGLQAKAQFAKRVATVLRRCESRRLQLGGVVVQVAGGSEPAWDDARYVAAWECWLAEDGCHRFRSRAYDLPVADRHADGTRAYSATPFGNGAGGHTQTYPRSEES